MLTGHVVVAMPAYNEDEGLPEFLREIERSLRSYVSSLTFVIVDDASHQPVEALLAVSPIDSRTLVHRNEKNLGHGPSAIRAYSAALELSPNALIHVDGDGQFCGDDFVRLLSSLDRADVVHGVRRDRVDPWYRRVITSTVRTLFTSGSRPVQDANTPFRAYRIDALAELIPRVRATSLVPHIHFSILEQKLAFQVHEVDVAHRARRGSSSVGTMWRTAKARRVDLPPWRLIRFCALALGELSRTDYRLGASGAQTMARQPLSTVEP